MERIGELMMMLITGVAAVALALLAGDFAERMRRVIYEARGSEVPKSGFRRLVTVVLALVLLGWVVAAYS